MSIIAENAFHDATIRSLTGGRVFVQIEINRSCRDFERAYCGTNCLLVAREAPRRRPLPESTIEAVVSEMLEVGNLVGDFALPGMEPTDTPNLLFRILKMIADAPAGLRPVTTGIITAGIRIPELRERFLAYPLDWLIVSGDLEEAGLRPGWAAGQALRNACDLKRLGGTGRVCANTIARGTTARLLELGRSIQDQGVDQWYLAAFRQVVGRQFVNERASSEMADMALEMSQHFPEGSMPVLVDVGLDEFRSRCDEVGLDHWRCEYRLPGSSVRLVALNRNPRIVRVRADGALLGPDDFFRVGVSEGAYGMYKRGSLAAVIRKLAGGPNREPASSAPMRTNSGDRRIAV